MKYAAIYIRVSTDEQVKHGFSLKEQEADLRRYAARRGYLVYDVYADEGVSARRRIKRRHELQRLLADIQNDCIAVVLVKCLDRWFRNVADFYEVQKILDAHHVGFECSQEEYNTTTSNGRLMLNLMLSIAQNESDQTSDRIKYIHDGLKRNKFEINNKHPFGYQRINNRLQVVESQRPVIEFIFADRLKGLSAQQIANEVYEKYSLSLTGKTVWRILQNRTYIGERHGMEDFCPAIIDKATFLQVQRPLRQVKKKEQHRKEIFYLFAGKVVCSHGDCRFVAHHFAYSSKCNPSGNVYRCNDKYNRPLNCDCVKPICQSSNSVRESDIERFLLENIHELLADYQLEWQDSRQTNADAEAQKAELQKKTERLKVLFIDGIISHDEFKKRYQKVQQNLQLVEARITYRQHMSKPMQMLQKLSKDDILQKYHALTTKQKRELWQALIERIEIGNTPLQRKQPYYDFKVIFY